MQQTSKLVHAVAGFVVSISSASYAWFQSHGSTIATGIAVVAGLYSIRAAHLTIKLRQAQQKALNEKHNRHIIHPRHR